MHRHYKYDVAISFAEEDRDAALALEQAFRTKDIVVYYYPNKRMDTLGNLKQKLINIYSNEAQYAVVLLSENYVNPDKEFVQIELAAMQARIIKEADIVYMVPIKLKKNHSAGFDPMNHPVFRGKTYLEWNHNPEEIVALIMDMLGRKTVEESIAEKRDESVIYNIKNSNTSNNVISNNNSININK